jgi:hypothetical protein
MRIRPNSWHITGEFAASVLAWHHKPSINVYTILAHIDNPEPYVTWRTDKEGNCYSGYYFKSYEEALANFRLRIT